MLIRMKNDPGVYSFAQLYEHVRDMLIYAGHGRKTVVFGPITPKNGRSLDENVLVLTSHAERLSESGWQVLDIVSFRPVFERLCVDMKIVGYPFPLLEDLTLPLIASGRFDSLHFVEGWQMSVGSQREHDEAMKHYAREQIVYL